MIWTTFGVAVEDRLQGLGIAFDQADLIAFLEANTILVDCEPDAALWAERFVELLREQRGAAIL